MVYALNVFNLLAGHENEYRDYSVKAGKIIYGMGGKVVTSGWKPIRNLHGDVERHYMIVVEFPSEAVFQAFLDEAPTTSGRFTNPGTCAPGSRRDDAVDAGSRRSD
jgi:uncharacterized protein (DUF1330 family)